MQALFQKVKPHIKPLLLLFTVFLAARAAFMLFMPFVFSHDVHAWVRVMNTLNEGGNPYAATEVLNWPPFWMQMIYLMQKLSGILHIWPERVIQLVLVAGEGLVMLVVYFILHHYWRQKRIVPLLLAGFALNPIAIFLTCQHGNFDIFVGLWILLFICAMLEYFRAGLSEYWLMACFCLGLGILTKTIPIILSPLLLAGVRRQSLPNIIFGLMLLFVPVLIGMSIIYTLAPAGVTEHVLQYRSMTGWYGITGIFENFNAETANEIYRKLSPLLFIGVMVFVGWLSFNVRIFKPQTLIAIVLLTLLIIPTFGPGYSPPYIFWYLGVLIIQYAIGDRFMKRYLVIGFIILALTYTTEYTFFLSHGSFATSIDTTPSMQSFCEWIGSKKIQVLVRIPMFLFYLGLVGILINRLRSQQIILQSQT